MKCLSCGFREPLLLSTLLALIVYNYKPISPLKVVTSLRSGAKAHVYMSLTKPSAWCMLAHKKYFMNEEDTDCTSWDSIKTNKDNKDKASNGAVCAVLWELFLEDMGLIPESGGSLGEGNGNPCQYSCWENPMDRGAWQVIVHGVSKSWIQLSD